MVNEDFCSPLIIHNSSFTIKKKMFNLFQNIHIDWLGKRKVFIAFSIFIMLAGLASTIGRQYTPGGTDAFNLGVDFKEIGRASCRERVCVPV